MSLPEAHPPSPSYSEHEAVKQQLQTAHAEIAKLKQELADVRAAVAPDPQTIQAWLDEIGDFTKEALLAIAARGPTFEEFFNGLLKEFGVNK